MASVELWNAQQAYETHLMGFVACCEETTTELNILADEIDKHYRNCNKGKIAGSTTAIGGFGLSVAGFVLSFFTFGASLGLVIAGAAVCGAGGVTTAGSTLVDHFITKNKCAAAQRALDKAVEKGREVKTSFDKLVCRLKNAGTEATGAPAECSRQIQAPAHDSMTTDIGVPIASGIKVAAGAVVAMDDIVGLTARGAAAGASAGAGTVFRGLTTGMRALHIGGFVVSALLVPVDIYTLITSSITEHRRAGSEAAAKLRKLAEDFKLPENFHGKALKEMRDMVQGHWSEIC